MLTMLIYDGSINNSLDCPFLDRNVFIKHFDNTSSKINLFFILILQSIREM